MADDSGRRDVLKRLGLIAGAIGTGSGMSLLSRAAGAQALPHLSLQDPIAQALAYHEDAATVKPEQFPSYRKGERCSTCAQLLGEAGQAWRPCNLFPNALVNADGWCRAWTVRSTQD